LENVDSSVELMTPVLLKTARIEADSVDAVRARTPWPSSGLI